MYIIRKLLQQNSNFQILFIDFISDYDAVKRKMLFFKWRTVETSNRVFTLFTKKKEELGKTHQYHPS